MILKPHSHTGTDSHTSHIDTDSHASDVERPRGLGVKLLYALGGLLVLGGVTYLAYELWGPVGFGLILLPLVRGPFDRAVEKVTGGYAAIVRRIATRRTLTMAVVGGFAAGIVVVNTQLATGFIPGEDQGIIYAVLQTPPGSTLEYTNAKSQELEEIAKEIKEVTSVTSLAGYEVLTEGRGSNSGTCIINLKTWSDRERTARQIIVDLEEKCRRMSNVKLEFFEPPAVPGFGTAGGISMLVLDKTFSADYQRLGDGDRQVHGRPEEAQGGDEPVHLLRRQLPAVRADHRQRRGHAEGRVDQGGDGQPQHPHRQHLGAGIHSSSTSSTRSSSRPSRSSGATRRTWTTYSSRTTRGTWSPTPRS